MRGVNKGKNILQPIIEKDNQAGSKLYKNHVRKKIPVAHD
jgi:hypothetical protein